MQELKLLHAGNPHCEECNKQFQMFIGGNTYMLPKTPELWEEKILCIECFNSMVSIFKIIIRHRKEKELQCQ